MRVITSVDLNTRTVTTGDIQPGTPDGMVTGTDLITDKTPAATGPSWSDVASITITTPGVWDVTAGFRAGTTSPPTGLSAKLTTDNGQLALGPVANRGSVWIGDTNTYSAQPHDLLTVTTVPCTVTLQAWSGKTAYVNGASIIARRIK